MRDVVVRLSSYQCLVKVREVFSSTPSTRYVSEGPMEGMGEGRELMVIELCLEAGRKEGAVGEGEGVA
jgi:hypothetical protein